MGGLALLAIGIYLVGVAGTWIALIGWPWHMTFREKVLLVTLLAIYWPYHVYRFIMRLF